MGSRLSLCKSAVDKGGVQRRELCLGRRATSLDILPSSRGPRLRFYRRRSIPDCSGDRRSSFTESTAGTTWIRQRVNVKFALVFEHWRSCGCRVHCPDRCWFEPSTSERRLMGILVHKSELERGSRARLPYVIRNPSALWCRQKISVREAKDASGCDGGQ